MRNPLSKKYFIENKPKFSYNYKELASLIMKKLLALIGVLGLASFLFQVSAQSTDAFQTKMTQIAEKFPQEKLTNIAKILIDINKLMSKIF